MGDKPERDTRRPCGLMGKANVGKEAKGKRTYWEPGVGSMACGESL